MIVSPLGSSLERISVFEMTATSVTSWGNFQKVKNKKQKMRATEIKIATARNFRLALFI
jgi:hypothetical protein